MELKWLLKVRFPQKKFSHRQGKLKQKPQKLDLRKVKTESVVKQAIEDVKMLPSLLCENSALQAKVEQLEKRISQLETQQARMADIEVSMKCFMGALKSFGWQAPEGLEALLPSSANHISEVKNAPEIVEQKPEGAEYLSFDESVLQQLNMESIDTINLDSILLSANWASLQQ